MQLAVSGPAGERALRVWGERIRDEIAALPGVTQVELAGAREYEVSIEVPEEALRRHGLTFDEVVRAVRSSSLDLPGGSIRTEGGEILLRAKGQAYRGEDFDRLVLLTREDGTRLMLGEVAQVVDGFVQDERSARFDEENAVMIRVYRVGDQKVLDLVETVLAYVDGAKARLPEGLTLTVWQNEANYLVDRLGILLENGRGGFILVFVLLALFLRLRLAFWVALGVPISILGALWAFPVVGMSIDVLSLFAFILVLGLLVDDAIVVGENVHTPPGTGRGAPVCRNRGRPGGGGPCDLRCPDDRRRLPSHDSVPRRDEGFLRRDRHRRDPLPLLLAGRGPADPARAPGTSRLDLQEQDAEARVDPGTLENAAKFPGFEPDSTGP